MSTDELRERRFLCFLKNTKAQLRRSSVLIGAPIGVFGVTTLFAFQANAQSPEARIDGIAANPAAIHAGGGIIFPTGTYLRSGIEGGVGASKNGLSGRADIVNRFHLDPFRQHKWAPYGGGGITTRFDKDRKTRVYLLLIAGMDGPVKNGLTTSIEAGLGGGARLGVVLRKTKAERR